MIMLTSGVLLWMVVHLMKRLAPGARAGLDGSIGANGARGVIALTLLVSLGLIVIGFRSSGTIAIYKPLAGMGHLNNLLMVFAVILIGAGSSKGRARTLLRHPMLTGALVWAIAHLLVNGDMASLILFGGIGIWSVLEMIVINRAEGPWQRPAAGPISSDIRLLVISAVLFVAIVAVHIYLGYSPFRGTYG